MIKTFKARLTYILSAVAVVLAVIPASHVHAAQITSRKVMLGSSAISTATTHKFDFTIPTTGNVGSIKFQYCTTASGACTKPTGLTTTGATLDAQTGATGFSANTTTDGAPYITRTASSITGGTAVSYTLGAITNPSTTNAAFYVRITTYASTDTSGGASDTGVVAASTANQIQLTATVDETLTFCTGTSGITSSSCAGATGSSVNLGTLNPSTAVSGTSQIGVASNAGSGYVITVSGTTLTSGSNTITALASPTTSQPGVAKQFGLNLRANSSPTVGSNPAGSGTGAATADYNTVNSFKFATGDTVAGAATADDFRLYTVSYIANIAGATPAGSYTTNLNFVATATF